jgi:LPXTG-motif cell wall-anchored protein
LLTDPIIVKIEWTQPDTTVPTSGSEASEWSAEYTILTDTEDTSIDSDGNITLDVENNKGTVLPSTGGTGVKVLYTVGAILAIGAAILLITRRRMKMMD